MKMSKIKGQKGLFVFSDPAGAKACLALAKSFKQKTLLIISDRKYSFYSEFNIIVNNSNYRSILEWYDFFDPDFVFTGTSLPAKIELAFLKEAKKKGIKTYSFVDHWTNMSERFKYFNEYIYPNELWVIDEYAKEIAINEGVKENIIVVNGNPYYDYLKGWQPNISRRDMLNMIGLKKDENYILYAPEPISTYNLEAKYGFDELSGLTYLNKILKNIKAKNFKIIVKAHPNQNHKIFEDYILEHNNNIYLKEFDLNNLIYYAKCVIGFFSNSLIEANVMGKKIFRLLIKLREKNIDILENKNIGKRIFLEKELSEELKKIVSKT